MLAMKTMLPELRSNLRYAPCARGREAALSNDREPDLESMSEFDPSKRAFVHDRLNDEAFEWVPERHMAHWEPVWEAEPGVIGSDGLLPA